VAEILAVKICAPPAGTVTGEGDTVTTISSFNATVTEAFAEESAALSAVIVKPAGAGMVAGAV
jgi:hypothetical protein